MSVKPRGRVVVVGGGPAASASVEELRRQGHEGDITLITEEPVAPYSRPPLSKSFLTGEVQAADLALGTADAQLITQTRATQVDLDKQRILLDSGETLPYDGLVIATGTRARRPSIPTVAVLQTLDEAKQLLDRLRTARSVLVVGSGFLAFEIASASHKHGATTTLVTRPGALEKRIGLLAKVLTDQALAAGVTVFESASCRFGDGFVDVASATRLEADLVIAAIGSDLNSSLLPGHNSGGIVVDDYCRARPNVVAAGDVAIMRTSTGLHHDPSWTHALAQGAAAARSLLDDDAPKFSSTAFAWTEAFGLHVKIAGVPPVGVRPQVIEGDLRKKQALLQWPGGAAAVGYRIPTPRLKGLAIPATLEM